MFSYIPALNNKQRRQAHASVNFIPERKITRVDGDLAQRGKGYVVRRVGAGNQPR